MNIRIRNTLTIALVGGLIVGAGTWGVRIYLPARVSKVQQELQEKQSELAEYQAMAAQIEEVGKRREQAARDWSTREHLIPLVSTAHEVYGAITHIAESKCHSLPYSYGFVERAKQDDAEYIQLELHGAGPFIDVYRFIWELENARDLYAITGIRLRWVDDDEAGTGQLSFNLGIRAYVGGDGPHADLVAARAEPKFPWISYNPFTPLVREHLPPNDRGLVEVERSSLRALSPTYAFIEDQFGELVTLEEGDEVYLGYLTRINTAASKARFTLNKGGLIETLDLELFTQGGE
jgi:hypothetical protein